MTRVGVSVPEHPRALAPERLPHQGRGDHRSERQIPARDPLRAGDQIGLQPEPPAREPCAAPPETGDHLIGDEEHPGLPADPARGFQVAIRRWEDTPGADHRFAEERGGPFRADPIDGRAERLGVIPRDLDHVLQQCAVSGQVRRDPREGGPRGMHPVVGAFAPDQDRSVRLPDERPEPANDLGRGVDRIRAAAGQEHLSVGHRRQPGDPLRQRFRWRVGQVTEGRVRGELRHLPPDGLGDLGPPVPDVAEPQAGGRIEVSVPLGIPDVGSAPADDGRACPCLHRSHVGERVPEAGHG